MKTSQKIYEETRRHRRAKKSQDFFGKKHLNWTYVDWIKGMFGDKIDFSIQNYAMNIYARRRSHHAFSSRGILPTSKHPTDVMVLVCMTSHGIAKLHICEGMMNATKYASVLEITLLPDARSLFGEGSWIFYIGNAHCH